MYEDYECVRPVMGCDQDAVEVAERVARRGASALTLTLMTGLHTRHVHLSATLVTGESLFISISVVLVKHAL